MNISFNGPVVDDDIVEVQEHKFPLDVDNIVFMARWNVLSVSLRLKRICRNLYCPKYNAKVVLSLLSVVEIGFLALRSDDYSRDNARLAKGVLSLFLGLGTRRRRSWLSEFGSR